MSFAPTAGKIRDLEAAVHWRDAAPGVVVFTNGVFDLLHRGHVEYLERARDLGDQLVVGVNDDRSAAGLGKGEGRPFVPVADRSRILAGLAAVDCVVQFTQSTPLDLIRALRPDVLVKGSDYTLERVVGADLVLARGGRVELVPLVPDRSTTLIMERIRGSR